MGNSEAKEHPVGTDVIYVLELDDGYYYVGKTNNLNRRFEEHKTGQGPPWTQTHKPVCVKETFLCTSELDEDRRTKEHMMKYGIEKVRGGSYTSVILTHIQTEALNKEMNTAKDECFVCGSKNHFANKCNLRKDKPPSLPMITSNKSSKCDKCGAFGHTREVCKSRKDITLSCTKCGKKGHSIDTCIVPDEINTSLKCDKCGKVGHVRDTCWSRIDLSLTCERCGKTGHAKETCYVKLDGKKK